VKILLVGSDEDSSGSLAFFQQDAGFETLTPGPEDRRTDSPDALVLDALAPVAIARRALEDSPTFPKPIPLILIAEAGCPNPPWIGIDRTADAVLPKPLDIRNLVGLLRTFEGLGGPLPEHGPPPARIPAEIPCRGKASRRRRT
jgi:DNA-binding response OmpR family regulator